MNKALNVAIYTVLFTIIILLAYAYRDMFSVTMGFYVCYKLYKWCEERQRMRSTYDTKQLHTTN